VPLFPPEDPSVHVTAYGDSLLCFTPHDTPLGQDKAKIKLFYLTFAAMALGVEDSIYLCFK
jgi:hypothetical protein